MNFKNILFTCLFSLLAMLAVALPPGGLGPGGGEDPDNDVPIDGGIGLLVAAGVALGAKKLIKKKD